MSEAAYGFKEGQAVWVGDGDGELGIPAIFVGEAESASWLGGAPCARVVDPETNVAEVVQIFRLTPRDE